MPKKDTDRGKITERMAARWFRDNGFPGTERTIRTGYRGTTRELADNGDLDLCPGVIAQIKSLRPANRAERAIPRWMDDTETQRQAAVAAIALLVVRRDGTSDVGEWWCFLRSDTVLMLLTEYAIQTVVQPLTTLRMTVAEAATWLRRAGYGTPDDAVQLEAIEEATA